MVRPALRSRRLRRKYVKTPGGRITIHYSRKKAGPALCARCKTKLNGTGPGRSPNRPFGGYYCSRCTREILKEMVMSNVSSS